MKEKKPLFLYCLLVLLFAYGVVTTLQVRKLESRVGAMETKLAHIFAPKVEKIAAR